MVRRGRPTGPIDERRNHTVPRLRLGFDRFLGEDPECRERQAEPEDEDSPGDETAIHTRLTP